jgi:hypothetical protein
MKHGRLGEIDYVSFLGLLGNHIAKMLTDRVFGVFEGVTPKKFASGKFRGIFRKLQGSSQPFIRVLEYQGPIAFSDASVFIIDPTNGTALDLSPLYLWGLNGPDEDPDLFEFDKGLEILFTISLFKSESINLLIAQAIWEKSADCYLNCATMILRRR